MDGWVVCWQGFANFPFWVRAKYIDAEIACSHATLSTSAAANLKRGDDHHRQNHSSSSFLVGYYSSSSSSVQLPQLSSSPWLESRVSMISLLRTSVGMMFPWRNTRARFCSSSMLHPNVGLHKPTTQNSQSCTTSSKGKTLKFWHFRPTSLEVKSQAQMNKLKSLHAPGSRPSFHSLTRLM